MHMLNATAGRVHDGGAQARLRIGAAQRDTKMLIRAAALAGYEELVASLGLDAAQQLHDVGLGPMSLRDPDAMISYRAMIELLERSAADASCRDLGLRLSRRQGIEILGPVAVAIEHAAALQGAIDFAAHHMYVHSAAIRLFSDEVPGRDDLVDLCFDIELADRPACTQTLELALGVILQCLRLLGQGHIEPVLVLLPHARLAAPRAYAEALGAACAYEQSKAAIRLKASDLSRPLPRSSAMMRRLAQSYIDTQFIAPTQALSERVRLLVAQLLSTGRATHDGVSRMLGVHPRTMQRRLVEEGTTFEKIKDNVRRELVRKLVERPDMPAFASVAGMLDYAEPSALTRSCHRWFGASPSELRRQSMQMSGE